ncbi:pentapeptide repeat-containing protein [Desulfosporosinus sp.]|uniref:pentapeptide repeat-containing protein n=1 Tax=Desulfosporosinus sp. TaxID=157907 RepID=UPI00260770AB|nr:pentapeptide repeat-containing protein [Desulfosporosinus sp.]
MSENHEYSVSFPEKNRNNLRADCETCFGLCCVALYFSALEGFPNNKEAGQACLNLQPDFRCNIHKNLRELGLKGCTAFDCFGAGQKVSQVSFGGHDWRKVPESANQMFKVFLIMRQLHELLWYLTETLTLQPARPIHGALSSMLAKTECLTHLSPDSLTHLSPDSLEELDVAAHRAEVNTLLLKTSELVRTEARRGQKVHSQRRKTFGRGACLIGADLRKMDLRGANLRGACLITANLSGTDLSGTDLIGADFRDADLRGADFTKSIFLTQAQLNVAKGDTSTKIPLSLDRPEHWEHPYV